MLEPNFSETQLQSAVNSAYMFEAHERYGIWAMPRLPSLFAEHSLGWDSAFNFPWLQNAPSAANEGCNFFIQYKLSHSLLTSHAKEWKHWNEQYFRFKVPHHCKDPLTGKGADDYHQWDRLKELANRGYPVYYATNWTLSVEELESEFRAGTFLDSLPMLDVRTVQDRHKFVTFTLTSSAFLLHSEPQSAPKVAMRRVIEKLDEAQMVPIAEATKDLINVVRGIWGDYSRLLLEDLNEIESETVEFLPVELQPWLHQARLSSALRRHLGIDMLWRPKSLERARGSR